LSSRRLALALLAALPLWPQTTVALPDGEGTLEWISPSSFRVCRSWGDRKCARAPDAGVDVSRSETPSRIRLSSRYLSVEIDKQDFRLRVLAGDGKELLTDTRPMANNGAEISVERVASPGEEFYGLGARADPQSSGRGQIIRSATPFLISSRGYGLHHIGPGAFTFDLASTKPDRCAVTLRPGQRFEFYFYYGPAPKAILEEHMHVVPPHPAKPLSLSPAASWEALADAARSLVHASLSAILNPAFDPAPYRRAPTALARRALQLAALTSRNPDSLEGGAMLWRQRMTPFFQAYIDETRTRGLPVIHPLAMEYPRDTEAARLTDEFMLGDEIMAAPVTTENGRRSVYFPMGNWTDLTTNKVYPGRQRVEIEAPLDEIPLFARNGSIVPMNSDDATSPMILHYLPKLASEFFLYEPDIPDYTPLHASPALDLIRLDIESKQPRLYEWAVHHMPAPKEVETGGKPYQQVTDRKLLRPGAWFYDRKLQNIHIAVQASAGETQTTHVSF